MKITNELNLPQPFVQAAKRDYQYTPKRYSATTILKGIREAILERRHFGEIEKDVSDEVWAIFGSAVHSILENSQESSTQIKENKLVIDMPNGYQLSGIFDLYDDATGTVTDYKTTSVWRLTYGDVGDWKQQLLIYCWMLRKIGFDAKRGEIVAMLKDHSPSKARTSYDYPNHPVDKLEWEFTDYDIESIELWINHRFKEIEEAEKLADDELPLCSKEERWHKDEKWAVMKKGRKKAVKLYDDPKEACKRVEEENQNAKGAPYSIEHRPGTDSKCLNYCSACEFCTYYLNHVKED